MTANVVTPKLLEAALVASEARMDTKLEKALVASEARMDTKLVALELRFDGKLEVLFVRLNLAMAQLRIDINADTLRSIQSVEESYRTRTAAAVEPYGDLPERVTTLEHAVGIKRS